MIYECGVHGGYRVTVVRFYLGEAGRTDLRGEVGVRDYGVRWEVRAYR